MKLLYIDLRTIDIEGVYSVLFDYLEERLFVKFKLVDDFYFKRDDVLLKRVDVDEMEDVIYSDDVAYIYKGVAVDSSGAVFYMMKDVIIDVFFDLGIDVDEKYNNFSLSIIKDDKELAFYKIFMMNRDDLAFWYGLFSFRYVEDLLYNKGSIRQFVNKRDLNRLVLKVLARKFDGKEQIIRI